MDFKALLEKCKGEKVVLNNGEECELIDVGEDFIVLKSGNTQLQLFNFIPLAQIGRLIRAEFGTGGYSLSIDTSYTTGDSRRTGH